MLTAFLFAANALATPLFIRQEAPDAGTFQLKPVRKGQGLPKDSNSDIILNPVTDPDFKLQQEESLDYGEDSQGSSSRLHEIRAFAN